MDELGWQHGAASAPGFANERKVDHLTLILEVGAPLDPCVRLAGAHIVAG